MKINTTERDQGLKNTHTKTILYVLLELKRDFSLTNPNRVVVS